jgi:hypothetical protein
MSLRAVVLGMASSVLLSLQAPTLVRADRADDGTAHGIDTERPRPRRDYDESSTWYGWQTLIADVPSLGLLVAGSATMLYSGPQDDQPVLFAIGLGGYVAATPILHLVHDNEWAPFSLALRVVGPALTLGGIAILSSAFDDAEVDGLDSRSDSGPILPIAGAITAILGVLVVVSTPLVDAVLATDRSRRSHAALSPWIGPRANAAGLLLTGPL